MPIWAIAGYLAGAFEVILPLVVAAIVWRRLHVSWRYFGYGALIFFLFQIATRVPITQLLQVAAAPQLASSPTALWAWLAFLALTAGLFEEVGRYVGYRTLLRDQPKTWDRAIMYGLGHGGLESIVLIGGGTLLTIYSLSSLAAGGLATLSPDQQAAARQQLAAVAAQPLWVWGLGAWERVCTLTIQVALSVLVLQVFVRRSMGWLGLAILLHALVDGVAVAVPQLLRTERAVGTLVTEAILTVLAAGALWLIWRLRQSPAQAASNGSP
jgi:uncharacterized membrane protein YhfC